MVLVLLLVASDCLNVQVGFCCLILGFKLLEGYLVGSLDCLLFVLLFLLDLGFVCWLCCWASV